MPDGEDTVSCRRASLQDADAFRDGVVRYRRQEDTESDRERPSVRVSCLGAKGQQRHGGNDFKETGMLLPATFWRKILTADAHPWKAEKLPHRQQSVDLQSVLPVETL